MRGEGAGDRVAGDGLVDCLLADDQLLLRLDQVQQIVDARQDLGAVARLGDEVVRPRARARFLVASSSSPEITITGIVLMRGSWELRMRSSRAKPSSLGIWMSENTTTIEGSVEIACQPASPSASSRTSKLLRIRREIVVRTIRESSTSSTRCLGMVVAGLALISSGHVDHDPALRRALDEGVEDLRELVEGYGAGHVLQVGGPQVAGEPPPHFPAKGHGVVPSRSPAGSRPAG